MQTLQQKIDSLCHYQYYCEDCEGIVSYEGHDSSHSITIHEVIRLPVLNKALQEFREQIDSLETHYYKVGNDYFIGISFHRVMELLGEQTNA